MQYGIITRVLNINNLANKQEATIYTTNLIENLYDKINQNAKNKLSFPNKNAFKKVVYCSLQRLRRSRRCPFSLEV